MFVVHGNEAHEFHDGSYANKSVMLVLVCSRCCKVPLQPLWCGGMEGEREGDGGKGGVDEYYIK